MVLILVVFYAVYKSEMFQELLLHLDSLNSMSSRPYIMRWRVLLPFYFGATCAELTVIRIAMNYLPSTVISILQYRSGALGTLHSSFFSSVSLSICAINAFSSYVVDSLLFVEASYCCRPINTSTWRHALGCLICFDIRRLLLGHILSTVHVARFCRNRVVCVFINGWSPDHDPSQVARTNCISNEASKSLLQEISF